MNDDQNTQNTSPIQDSPDQDSNVNQNSNTQGGIMDFIMGILDRIFQGATGRQMMLRVLVCVIIFLMALIWAKGDIIAQAYKDSKYDTYAKLESEEKDKKFVDVAKEQIQIMKSSSRADLAALYSFRPKDMNYFVDLVTYEGNLPQSVDPKNLGGYPIDKQSVEYITHISGSSFTSINEFAYLPTKERDTEIKFMYSCPLFNLENVYSGSIEMYWFNTPPTDERKLFLICNQTARVLGRVR